jgi:hypothetical protein
MKTNVGNLDRVIRFLLAGIFFLCFLTFEGNLRYIGLIGFVPLITAFLSWCPLYSLFGISSCPIEKTVD